MKIFVTIMALAFFIINLNASILSLNLGDIYRGCYSPINYIDKNAVDCYLEYYDYGFGN